MTPTDTVLKTYQVLGSSHVSVTASLGVRHQLYLILVSGQTRLCGLLESYSSVGV